MIVPSHRDEGPEEPAQGRRVDESMTLLTSMMERPLDPGYAAAAQRRERAGLTPSTGLRTPTVIVAAFVTGLLITLGAVALRAPSNSATKARAELVSQVEERRAAVDKEAASIRTMRAEVDRLQELALADVDTSLRAQLVALSLVSGAEPVTGKGLVVVLDNAPGSGANSADGDPRTDTAKGDGVVFSKDLQMVVNGLWEAGAEAISVNGQRLTSKSAIRFAGEAILVNYRPLARPYTISAIGDPARLEVEFADSAGGAYARALKTNYGIRVSIDAANKLTLPAAASLTVREAVVPTTSPSTSRTAPPTSKGTP